MNAGVVTTEQKLEQTWKVMEQLVGMLQRKNVLEDGEVKCIIGQLEILKGG